MHSLTVVLSDLTFGQAVQAMDEKKLVARTGWNGKGMFLFKVPGSEFHVSRAPLLGIFSEGTLIKYRSHIDMFTADGDVVPWTCSQSDIQASDWCVVVRGDSSDA